MDGKYSIEDLKYNLPDYISKKIVDPELVKEIEKNLESNIELKREYDILKSAFGFLKIADFEQPPGFYFTNLPLKINQNIEQAYKKGSLWNKVSIFWKLSIPAAAVIILLFILFNTFKERDAVQNPVNDVTGGKTLEEKNHISDSKNLSMKNDPVTLEKPKPEVIQDPKTKKHTSSRKIITGRKKPNKILLQTTESPVPEMQNDGDNDLYTDIVEEPVYEESEEDEAMFYSNDEELYILEDEFLNLTPEEQKEIIDNLYNSQI